jgi:hypothetical protein
LVRSSPGVIVVGFSAFTSGAIAKRARVYHNRTIYGSLRHAQTYLTRKLHEGALCRGAIGVPTTLDEFLDYWLKRAAKPKVREKTYKSYKDIGSAIPVNIFPEQS